MCWVTLVVVHCVGVWWMATRFALETSRSPHLVWEQHPQTSGRIVLWGSSSKLQKAQWMQQKARVPYSPFWRKSWGLLPRQLLWHNCKENTNSEFGNSNILLVEPLLLPTVPVKSSLCLTYHKHCLVISSVMWPAVLVWPTICPTPTPIIFRIREMLWWWSEN